MSEVVIKPSKDNHGLDTSAGFYAVRPEGDVVLLPPKNGAGKIVLKEEDADLKPGWRIASKGEVESAGKRAEQADKAAEDDKSPGAAQRRAEDKARKDKAEAVAKAMKDATGKKVDAQSKALEEQKHDLEAAKANATKADREQYEQRAKGPVAPQRGRAPEGGENVSSPEAGLAAQRSSAVTSGTIKGK